MRSLAAILLLLMSVPAVADEFRPAMLDIAETVAGSYAVTWKVPTQSGSVLPVTPLLPGNLERLGPPATRTIQGSVIEQSIWRATSGSLVGETIAIDGLSSLPLEVIVQIDLADGSEHAAILRSSSTSFVVPEQATRWQVAGSYWKIGTIHILEGIDHLLFVLALILIIPNLLMLIKTITAFTLAHSVSLALATLGIVNMPGPPTEAVIALSIMFLAVEIIRSGEGKPTLTAQRPWIVALIFGLVHGLGFAGALAEVGLPEREIPLALLMFNVGVETGQLLFVGFVLVATAVLARLPVKWPEHSWKLVPYAIGTVATFWTLERIEAFV